MNNTKRQREKVEEGRRFLSYFEPLMTTREAAKIIGCSQQAVHQTEAIAAYKVVRRMRALLDADRRAIGEP